MRKDFSKGLINRNLYCNHFFFNSRIFFSICCITPLKSSSVFPVGSSSFQLSYYDIEFRIVRIRLDNGTYICIATNLSEEEFPLEEINKLYRMRWSEETSFRELKYTIGLINWHSSKYDGILQEINARMILYNFCELVTSHAVVKTSKNTKHVYKINFAIAVNICRAYLKHGGNETETMLLIQKYLTPVRYNRKYPIHLRPKRNRDFMYRVA